MTKDRLDVLVCKTWGYTCILNDLWKGIRKGQLKDPMMREAIIADYKMISRGLEKISMELEQDTRKPEDA